VLLDALRTKQVMPCRARGLEIANSLTVAVRKRRVDAAFRQAALSDLALLDITTD
jgi:hypothetical protein